jgi:hypothetical protein
MAGWRWVDLNEGYVVGVVFERLTSDIIVDEVVDGDDILRLSMSFGCLWRLRRRRRHGLRFGDGERAGDYSNQIRVCD